MSDIDFDEDQPLPDELAQMQLGTDDEPKPEEAETDQKPDDGQDTGQDEDAEGTDKADEGEQADETADSDAEQAEESDTEPGKLTRNQRRALKLAEQAQTIASRDAEIAALKEQLAKVQEGDAPEPPKEADFGDDFEAFEEAKADHRFKKAFKEARDEDRAEDLEKQIEARETARFVEATKQFDSQVPEVVQRLPDYREKAVAMVDTLNRAGAAIPQETLQMIYDDPNGHSIIYAAASDETNSVLSQLVNLPPLQAAAYVGRLSGALSAQTPKKTTSAPKPISPPKGGGSGEVDPNKMDYAQFKEWRSKGGI